MDSEVVIPGHIWALEIPEPSYGSVSPPLSHLHHDPAFVNAARGKKRTNSGNFKAKLPIIT